MVEKKLGILGKVILTYCIETHSIDPLGKLDADDQSVKKNI